MRVWRTVSGLMLSTISHSTSRSANNFSVQPARPSGGSAQAKAIRACPVLDRLEDMEPLASTNPATPRGARSLVGQGSKSGARHEIDGAGQGTEIGAWIESKARTSLDKSDIAVFDLKCFDFYRAAASEYPEQTAKARWWPVLVSSEPTGEAVRIICCDLGVVLCDPRPLPLPALLFAASRPNADDYLPGTHLSELIRLAEAACAPMQQRWRLNIDRREVSLRLDNMHSTEIADLLFLQDELTEDFLDDFEMHAPGALDQRASALFERFEAARLAI